MAKDIEQMVQKHGFYIQITLFMGFQLIITFKQAFYYLLVDNFS